MVKKRKQYKSGDFISCLYRNACRCENACAVLHRHDYAVYVPVFSGHGTPDVEDILASSPEAWYEDAKRAVDFVRGEGFHTVAAFGLSMGGIMATKLATEHLVEYAGTFCSPVSSGNPQLPGLFQSFMMYCEGVL